MPGVTLWVRGCAYTFASILALGATHGLSRPGLDLERPNFPFSVK